MATYTAIQIKDYTSVPSVANWSDDKILLYQNTAETVLASLDPDNTMSGYQAVYDSAVMMIFDWLAENPTGLKSSSRGKVSQSYGDLLPITIRTLLKPYVDGASGLLSGARIARNDIGLR